MITRFEHAAQNVAQFRFVIHQAQKRLAARALHADAEDVLRGRIQIDNQKALIDEDNASAKAIKNALGISMAGTVTAGAPGRVSA